MRPVWNSGLTWAELPQKPGGWLSLGQVQQESGSIFPINGRFPHIPISPTLTRQMKSPAFALPCVMNARPFPGIIRQFATIMNDKVNQEAQTTITLDSAAQLESLLFVSSGPVSVNRLATVLDITPYRVNQLLEEMADAYANRGLRLQITTDGVQLTTAPEANDVIERYLGLELTSRLSQAALEVLAIVAYMQPVTRPQIDQVRGVNSDGALRTLLSKGLIEELGRLETPGRPILYGTTADFLQYFGLTSLEHLPPLDEEEE